MAALEPAALLGLLRALLQGLVLVLSSLLKSLLKLLLPNSLLPKKSLRGQTVLVTGAGGAIGRALATELALEGARLALWDRDAASNDLTAQACQKLEAKVHCQSVDITDRAAVYRAAQQLRDEFGEVDVLVNNAGVLNPTPFLDTDDELISRLVDVNLKSVMWVTKAFLPGMLERRRGHVVTLGSAASLVGAHQLVDYSASKFGVLGFMEALQNWVLASGVPEVVFTTVCPYYIRTPMIAGLNIVNRILPFLRVEQVARRTVEAIRLEQRLVVMPWRLALLHCFKQLLPANLVQSLVIDKPIHRHS